jgi:hypothetical protein
MQPTPEARAKQLLGKPLLSALASEAIVRVSRREKNGRRKIARDIVFLQIIVIKQFFCQMFRK